MRFGVVQCGNCKNARGVRLNAKTSVCPNCGKRMDLKKVRILEEVETERELAAAVMRVNTLLKEGKEVYAQDLRDAAASKDKGGRSGGTPSEKGDDTYDRIAKKLIFVKSRDDKVVAAAKELCRHVGDFTIDDFKEVLARVGVDTGSVARAGVYLKKLKDSNIIYEPKSGTYRCLDS